MPKIFIAILLISISFLFLGCGGSNSGKGETIISDAKDSVETTREDIDSDVSTIAENQSPSINGLWRYRHTIGVNSEFINDDLPSVTFSGEDSYYNESVMGTYSITGDHILLQYPSGLSFNFGFTLTANELTFIENDTIYYNYVRVD